MISVKPVKSVAKRMRRNDNYFLTKKQLDFKLTQVLLLPISYCTGTEKGIIKAHVTVIIQGSYVWLY